MLKSFLERKGFLMLVVFMFTASVFSQEAFARPGGGAYHGGGENRYHYRDGRWYRDGLFWFDAGLATLTIGAIAASLPPRYTTVYAGNAPYYYDSRVYYRPCPEGYIVVPAPTAVQPVIVTQVENLSVQPAVTVAAANQSAVSQQESFTVNVPNFKGGYTSVALTKHGAGFVGPQGEYYPEFPKVGQLKEMYGK